MVLAKNIAHDMKSGADGAHFFGALLLTFSFDKHSVDRINQSAPMRKYEVKSQKKYEEKQLGSPVVSLFRVVSSIMIGLAIIFVILLLK